MRPTADEEAIKRTFYNIDDWKRAIAQLAMTNLRQEFGDLTLDESLVARETIATNLQRILNTFAVEWGLTVSKVEIKLIDFDPPIEKPHTFIKALTPQTVERLGYLVGPAMAHQIFTLMKELKEDLGFEATCRVSLEPEGNGQTLPDKSRS